MRCCTKAIAIETTTRTMTKATTRKQRFDANDVDSEDVNSDSADFDFDDADSDDVDSANLELIRTREIHF